MANYRDNSYTADDARSDVEKAIPIVVKLAAFVGAVQLVKAGIDESDVERNAHGGLGGPLVGFFRGIGNAFIGSFQSIGRIASRLLPPKDPQVDLAHLVDGLVVLAGPAVLALLFTSIYVDAKRKGEFGLKRDGL